MFGSRGINFTSTSKVYRQNIESKVRDVFDSFDRIINWLVCSIIPTEGNTGGSIIPISGNWNYRATSISFGGYDRADQPVYDAIKTIKNIPDFGFNVLTIDFRCTGKIDTSAPKHYPLSTIHYLVILDVQ